MRVRGFAADEAVTWLVQLLTLPVDRGDDLAVVPVLTHNWNGNGIKLFWKQQVNKQAKSNI